MHKGKVKNKILTILTGPARGGDCGYRFEIGSSYTIFTYTHPVIINGKTVNKFLTTSICTRTQKFEEKEYNEIVKHCKSKGY
jgi:hypothetical protein